MVCNLSDLPSVRAFARAFKAKHGSRLDVLVNNGECTYLAPPTSLLDVLAVSRVWKRLRRIHEEGAYIYFENRLFRCLCAVNSIHDSVP